MTMTIAMEMKKEENCNSESFEIRLFLLKQLSHKISGPGIFRSIPNRYNSVYQDIAIFIRS